MLYPQSKIENRQFVRGDVAQTGEHLLCKQGVSGSIPLISTMGTAEVAREDLVLVKGEGWLFDN